MLAQIEFSKEELILLRRALIRETDRLAELVQFCEESGDEIGARACKNSYYRCTGISARIRRVIMDIDGV